MHSFSHTLLRGPISAENPERPCDCRERIGKPLSDSGRLVERALACSRRLHSPACLSIRVASSTCPHIARSATATLRAC